MAAHPDLQAEQAYIDRAYVRLDAMRRAAEELRDSVIGAGKGGTHQARVERDVFVRTSLQRLEQLQLGRSSLCFGRIDRAVDDADSDTNGDASRGHADGDTNGDSNRGHADRDSNRGHADRSSASNGDRDSNGRHDDGDGSRDERFYIGRLAVSDENQEPMVVDWRAPIAEAFYRATGRAPMGLRRRRHFATDGRTLLGIEDELFSTNGDGVDDLELVGPGALLAALERSRSGQMRDIVATVQREQDEIIRAELPGVLVVQGGPGTGKTAVALHRAAYLLYTHRFPLESQGVLVVGPNQLFLRYIEQVLPSLGESGVVLTTIGGLMPSVRGRAVDSPLAERVKGDARMARVLAHAVADRQRPLRGGLRVPFGATTLRLSERALTGMVHAAKRRGGTHNGRRRMFETMVVRALSAESAADLRRHPAVVDAMNRMWPILTPEDFLNDLFGAPALLELATRDILTPAERDALARPRAHSLDEAAWSAADIPLLDEARALLGSPRTRKNGEDDDVRGYGHILVDEAQDVTPMALRMLGRRSISGSITLVGDIGQATTSSAPPDWDAVIAHLPQRRPPRVAELTVNYRTPGEIMDLAGAVLAAANVAGVSVPRSVRATGRAPVVRPLGDLAAVVVGESQAVDGGTVAVIAPAGLHASIRATLDATGLPWGEPDRTGLSAPVTLLDLPSAKGLEFDSVIVVEPAAFALRSLYVALTRTTRRLAIVHDRPLPAALADALSTPPASVDVEISSGDAQVMDPGVHRLP